MNKVVGGRNERCAVEGKRRKREGGGKCMHIWVGVSILQGIGLGEKGSGIGGVGRCEIGGAATLAK